MSRLIEKLANRSLFFGLFGEDYGDSPWGLYATTWGANDSDVIKWSFIDVAGNGYVRNGIIYGLLTTRIQMFSEARFMFRDTTTKRMFTTADLTPLQTPWPYGTTSDLLTRMLQDADICGTSFVRRCDDGSLERLRPDWVTVISEVDNRSGRREVVGITYDRNGYGDQHIGNGTDLEVYTAEDVVIWAPNPDPLSHFRGTSWIQTVLTEVNNDEAMRAHVRNFFRNAATPNLVYKYPKPLRGTDREQVMAALEAKYAGPSKAGRTLVVDQGADVQVVGSSFEAMGFTNISSAGMERMAIAAGVPSILVGIPTTASRATLGTDFPHAMQRFANMTMRPLWRSVCTSLAQFIPGPPGAELWYDTSDIASLQSSELESAQVTQTQAATINDLVMNGWDDQSAIKAVTSNDVTQLVHTGLLSVQLQKPGGDTPPDPDAATEPDPQDPNESDEEDEG